MHPLKRFFKRHAHNRLFKALAGLGRAMHRLYENRNYDVYSNGEYEVLRKLKAFSPQVIIDGGANLGHYSLMVQQVLPGCRVFAFEPVPETFARLQHNLTPYPRLQPIPQGLYAHTGPQRIHLYPSHTHASVYDIQGVKYQPQGQVEIQLLRGDEFMQQQQIQRIDLLKIDVEGAEYEVLQGFRQALSEGRITAVQFEYGYINITTKKLLIDFYQLFEGYGYRVGKIFPKGVEFRPYHFKYEDFIGPNFIAVHQSQTELIERLQP